MGLSGSNFPLNQSIHHAISLLGAQHWSVAGFGPPFFTELSRQQIA
jgi:hypothetical protein